MISDLQYYEFLRRMVEDQRGRNRLITLNEFEVGFVFDFSRDSRQSIWLTERRRACVDRMWRKHGPDLNFPHPLDTIHEQPRMAAADPTGCEYLVKDENGRQRRCNEPAEFCEPGRLRYCATHVEAVRRAWPKTQLIAFNHHEAAQAESVVSSGPDQAKRIDAAGSIKPVASAGGEGKSSIAARGDFKFPKYT